VKPLRNPWPLKTVRRTRGAWTTRPDIPCSPLPPQGQQPYLVMAAEIFPPKQP
jgi:hypothetical protein